MGKCFSKQQQPGQRGTNGYSNHGEKPPAPASQQQQFQQAQQRRPQEDYANPAQPPPLPAPDVHHEPQTRPPPHVTQQPQAPAPPVLRPPVTAAAHPDTILGKPLESVESHYTMGKELGRGQFGVTYLCTEKATGLRYACKFISKRKLIKKSDRDDMRRENQIMQHLTGQPNIVEFKGAYEDASSVNLVMELCAGREQFDRIIAKGHYSERAAAAIFRAIANVVNVCHFMGVMHRDASGPQA